MQDEQTILNNAICRQHDVIKAVVGELSVELCKKLAPMNQDCLRQALAAAEALHTALHAAAVLRSRLIQGGYDVCSDVLKVHHFPAGAVLGSPDRVGQTPAALFKTFLSEQGII